VVRIVQQSERWPRFPRRGGTLDDEQQRAAGLHELAAADHRTAAKHNEVGESTASVWHSERALEYADHADKLAREVHNKSGEWEISNVYSL
jgi:hypothetical protein